ncbi:major facilitator superfamily domain-containing protein [Mycena sp. CBHHK59/15]|nr:major facilitator superfamily domain-containing protein [Mycena sp. CBHHK59/15]
MSLHATSNNEGETLNAYASDEKEKAPGNEDDYPHGLKLGLLMISLCLSVFLVALIIATAIPKITDQLKSLADVGWFYTVSLSNGGPRFFSSALIGLLSRTKVYIAAILVFEIGSALCGFIVGRAIAAHAVPLAKRPLFTGLIGAMYGIASVAGPLMGGVLTDKVTWRWCFYINLPIGAVTLLVMTFFFKMPKSADHDAPIMAIREQRINQFDPWGTLLFIPAIVCLLLALQWGGSKYEWKNGRIIALFLLFGILIICFLAVQSTVKDATVPPRIFKTRSIWAGGFFSFCLGSSYFIIVFYLPIWFQAVRGVSAVKSGIDNLPMILSVVVSSLLAGSVITILGYYTPFILLSTVLMSVGAGLLSTLTPSTGHVHWIWYQIVFGLGVGFGLQQSVLAAQTVLDVNDVAIGTSIPIFMDKLGGALFISIAQNVFTNKLVFGLVAHVPGVSPTLVLSAGATSLKTAIPAEYLPAVLQVYNDALMSAVYVSVAMTVLSFVGAAAMEWKSIKGKNIEMATGA